VKKGPDTRQTCNPSRKASITGDKEPNIFVKMAMERDTMGDKRERKVLSERKKLTQLCGPLLELSPQVSHKRSIGHAGAAANATAV
jgi:hypothetical protein